MKPLLLFLIFTCHVCASGTVDELLKDYFQSLRNDDSARLKNCFLSKGELASRFKPTSKFFSSIDEDYSNCIDLFITDSKALLEKANSNIGSKNNIHLTEFFPLKYDDEGSMIVIPKEDLSKINYIPALLVTFHWGTQHSGSNRQLAFISGALLRRQGEWKFAERFKNRYLINYHFVYALSRRTRSNP